MKKKTEPLPPEVKELFEKFPAIAVIGSVLLFHMLGASSGKAPKWLKDLPPIGGRTNGAWRGKGSFGHGFGGVKVRHK